MTDYCLFTVEHPSARRIYIRGVADITEPIDEYNKIISFYDGSKLQSKLPKNPYEDGSEEQILFNELLSAIKSNFEDFGDELVFATEEDEEYEWLNHKKYGNYNLELHKVVIT